MSAMHNPYELPEALPKPVDDGGAGHLVGARIPEIWLPCTDGRAVRVHEALLPPTVLFFYPRTGVPGEPPSRGFDGEYWDEVPGARGCTPQNCGFRDQHVHFGRLSVQVFGVSTQTTAFQREFKERNHIPFEYLSDAELKLVRAMRLPTFEFPVEAGGPNTLTKRMSWFVYEGRIKQIWYPVFPPNENAERVLSWINWQLRFYVGDAHDGIVYRRDAHVSVEEMGRVFESSGIKRPHHDLERLGCMLRHANLTVTAHADGRLVGIARSLSDFSWCCYVSDLAVDLEYQRQGVGRRLLEVVQKIVGDQCTVILNAAPGAESYYPRVGFEQVASAWKIQRTR